MAFIDILEQSLKKSGISQAELARQAGVSPEKLSYWKNYYTGIELAYKLLKVMRATSGESLETFYRRFEKKIE